MKPNEHEFKVMGLAPYSKIEYSMKVYNEVFKDILDVKTVKLYTKIDQKIYLNIFMKIQKTDSILLLEQFKY